MAEEINKEETVQSEEVSLDKPSLQPDIPQKRGISRRVKLVGVFVLVDLLLFIGLIAVRRLKTQEKKVPEQQEVQNEIAQVTPQQFLETLLTKVRNNEPSSVSSLISPRATIDQSTFKELYGKNLTYEITNTFIETQGTIAHFTLSIDMDGTKSLHRIIIVKEVNQWMLADHEKIEQVQSDL